MRSIERAAWQSIGDGWRQLYGSMRSLGVSIESHEFRSDSPLNWGASFHPDSVEICLNFEGRGEVEASGGTIRFAPNTIGLYIRALEPLRAIRAAGERHRFITVELSHAWLVRTLASHEKLIAALLRETLFASPPRNGVGVAQPMNLLQETIATALTHPPVSVAGRPLWFEAKVLELLSDLVFATGAVTGEELFCDRQKRLARLRVAKAKEILRARLVDPPTLEDLGREIGISSFYLSRTFSKETGMSIPQFIRRIRIERAAELIREGSHNVSEAAFAVGYSSLGHFSKSFCDIKGVCPALFLQGRDNELQDRDSL